MRQGWAYAPQALDPDLITALRADALHLIAEGEVKAAAIGRGDLEQRAPQIRKTSIAWMDGASQAQRDFLEGCEAMRLSINRALFAGLFEFEAHYAHYPLGGFYKRHLDAFSGPAQTGGPSAMFGPRAGRSRIVSCVVYLNDNWRDEEGGQLALWQECPLTIDNTPDLDALNDYPPSQLISPKAGGLVLMMSEQIPHEVYPSTRDRLAIAGWWRVNASIGGRIDPGR